MVRVSTSPSLPHDEPVCQDAERARAAGLGSLVGVTWGQWDESLRGLREHAGTRPHKAVPTLPREVDQQLLDARAIARGAHPADIIGDEGIDDGARMESLYDVGRLYARC